MFELFKGEKSINCHFSIGGHLLALLTILFKLPSSSSELREYCFPKSFNVTCPDPNDVILMTSAKYGRMIRGHCVTSDYYVGCWAEVLIHVDRKCSGKNSCFLAIPDAEMHQMQPCPKDLLAYLEADYECVRTHNLPSSETCQKEGVAMVKLSGAKQGWVSSLVASNSGLGSDHCPWVFVLSRGQTIKLTLYDFVASLKPSNENNLCHVYAKVRDVGHHSEFTVCGGRSRERVVHRSEGNRVEVTLMNVEREGQPVHFLLKYEAVGCADPVLPGSSMLLRREGDTAVVSCNTTLQVWHIVCQGNSWFGKMDNCSHELMQFSHLPADRNMEYFKNGLFVAVVIGLILGLLIGFLMLAVIVACNKSKQNMRRCDDGEEMDRELQYEVKMHINKASLGTGSDFRICSDHICDDSKKWSSECFMARQSPNMLDNQLHNFPSEVESGQSKQHSLVYGLHHHHEQQSYQQLQQTQQNMPSHHLLRNDSTTNQFILETPHRPISTKPKETSFETLSDISVIRQMDVCPQQIKQIPGKFDVYEKPCHIAFCN